MNDEIKNEYTLAMYAEWRGAVKTALDYIKGDLVQLHAVDESLWAIVEKVRAELGAFRDRCDVLSCAKVSKADADALRKEFDLLLARLDKLADKVDECVKEQFEKYDKLDTKVDKNDKDQCGALEAKVTPLAAALHLQDKAQVKQQVTMAFFGMIGGALFWFLGVLINYFLNHLPKGP